MLYGPSVPSQCVTVTVPLKGKGVPQDDAEALKWYRRAADQGHALAQHSLGLGYAAGRGVPQDFTAAYMWMSLSAAAGAQNAPNVLDQMAGDMTPKQIAKAQKLAREWRPK